MATAGARGTAGQRGIIIALTHYETGRLLTNPAGWHSSADQILCLCSEIPEFLVCNLLEPIKDIILKSQPFV